MLERVLIFFGAPDPVAPSLRHRLLPRIEKTCPSGSWRRSQQDLAREAEVGVVTIRQLEAGVNRPRRATLVLVRHKKRRGSNSSRTTAAVSVRDFGR